MAIKQRARSSAMAKPIYRNLTRRPSKPARESTERELLAAIIAAPDDDAPRLVYADWLTQRGDPRGEFITIQLELAKLCDADDAQTAALRAREADLLSKHKRAWVGRFGGTKIQHGSTAKTWTKTNPTKWDFERGFVAWCSMKSADFVRNAPALLEAEPLRRAHLTDAGIGNLARVPEIAMLRELDLRRVRLKTTVATLVRATCFRNLEVLGLEQCGLGVKATAVFAKADPERLPKLFALELANNGLGDAGAKLLAAAPILRQIRWLDLSNNNIGDAGARAIAESPYLERIEYLDIDAPGDGPLRQRFGARLRDPARFPTAPHALR
jgi:uncharacterized protein (TIGR02996 family)